MPLKFFRLYYLKRANSTETLVSEKFIVRILQCLLPAFCLGLTAIAFVEDHFSNSDVGTTLFHLSYCRQSAP